MVRLFFETRIEFRIMLFVHLYLHFTFRDLCPGWGNEADQIFAGIRRVEQSAFATLSIPDRTWGFFIFLFPSSRSFGNGSAKRTGGESGECGNGIGIFVCTWRESWLQFADAPSAPFRTGNCLGSSSRRFLRFPMKNNRLIPLLSW